MIRKKILCSAIIATIITSSLTGCNQVISKKETVKEVATIETIEETLEQATTIKESKEEVSTIKEPSTEESKPDKLNNTDINIDAVFSVAEICDLTRDAITEEDEDELSESGLNVIIFDDDNYIVYEYIASNDTINDLSYDEFIEALIDEMEASTDEMTELVTLYQTICPDLKGIKMAYFDKNRNFIIEFTYDNNDCTSSKKPTASYKYSSASSDLSESTEKQTDSNIITLDNLNDYDDYLMFDNGFILGLNSTDYLKIGPDIDKENISAIYNNKYDIIYSDSSIKTGDTKTVNDLAQYAKETYTITLNDIPSYMCLYDDYICVYQNLNHPSIDNYLEIYVAAIDILNNYYNGTITLDDILQFVGEVALTI